MLIPRMKSSNEKKIIILSGAGISAPSGISTFRDSNGLWENHNIEEICNEWTWKDNFEAVHKFYNQRRKQLSEVRPNIAHKVIAQIIEKYGDENVYNITQNVDDLFERVDVNTLHLHGELTKMQCEACGNIWDIGYEEFIISKDRCTKCNSLKGVRPKIVFFNGAAPMYEYLNRALKYTDNPDTIIVVIGTMGNVVPIEAMIKNKRCKKILCNLESNPHIDDDNFDKVYYESIETAISKIQSDIDSFWNKY